MCRHATFFLVAPAHVLFYGVQKTFLNMICKSQSREATGEQNALRLTTEQKRKIDAFAQSLTPSSACTKTFPKLRCVRVVFRLPVQNNKESCGQK